MAERTLYLTSSVSGNVSTPANALGTSDNTGTTDTGNTDWTHRWAFTPESSGLYQTSDHRFQARVRKDASGGSDPTFTPVVYVNGASVTIVEHIATFPYAVANTGYGNVEWRVALADISPGDTVEVELVTQAAGGGPNSRCVQLDAILWIADHTTGTTLQLAGAVTSTSTVAGDIRRNILDGIAGSWRFEENPATNGDLLVDDLGTYNGTNNGAATATGRDGNAWELVANGTAPDDFIDLGSPASLENLGEITFMVDFYPTAAGTTSASNVFGYFLNQAGTHLWHIGWRSDQQFRGRVNSPSAAEDVLSTGGPYALNTWHRVIVRWTAGNPPRINVNADSTETGSTNIASMGTSTLNINFGMDDSYSGYTNRYLNGRVDNAIVWTRDLEDYEVTRLTTGESYPTAIELGLSPTPTLPLAGAVTGTSTVAGDITEAVTTLSLAGSITATSTVAGDIRRDILDGIIASYRFEQDPSTNGNLLVDDLGLHNGTNDGAALNASGRDGNGWDFVGDGTAPDDSVSFGIVPEWNLSNGFTAVIDFFPTASGGSTTSNIFGNFYTESGGYIWQIGWQSTNQFRFRIVTGSILTASSAAVSLNTWHRAVIRWNGENTDMKIRVNQLAEVTTSTNGTGALRTDQIGSYLSFPDTYAGLSTRALSGRMDNAMLWNRELSDAEVDRILEDTTSPTYPTFIELGGSPTPVLPLGGAVNASATVAGDLTVAGITLQLTGAVTSTSTITGNITEIDSLTGAVNANTTVAGDITETAALTGAVTATSTLAGNITETNALTGAVTATSTVSGDITIAGTVLQLAGAVTSTSTVAGEITETDALTGAVNASSTVAGTITETDALAGSVTASSTVAGAITTTEALDGAITGTSTLSGNITETAALEGAVTATTTVAGDLGIAGGNQLAGAITATSTVSGELTSTETLAGAVNATSTVSGDLGTTVQLSGAITATSTVAGEIVATEALNGAVTASSTVAGDLTVAGTAQSLAGAITATSTVQGDIGVVLTLEGSITATSTVAGELTRLLQLGGAISASSTINGDLALLYALQGTINAQSSIAGDLEVFASLAGGITAQSVVAGNLGFEAVYKDLGLRVIGNKRNLGLIIGTRKTHGTIQGN